MLVLNGDHGDKVQVSLTSKTGFGFHSLEFIPGIQLLDMPELIFARSKTTVQGFMRSQRSKWLRFCPREFSAVGEIRYRCN